MGISIFKRDNITLAVLPNKHVYRVAWVGDELQLATLTSNKPFTCSYRFKSDAPYTMDEAVVKVKDIYGVEHSLTFFQEVNSDEL